MSPNNPDREMDNKQTEDQPKGKKRRSNVNKACENCRRRRIKCDGVRPSCGTCAVYKDECHWEAREDYRKPLSRGQVQALVTRVQDLERLLRQHNVDPGNAQEPTSQHGETPVDRPERKHGGKGTTNSDDPRDWTVDHLVEREAGDHHLHGPTSAFRYLGRYPRDGTSALNIYPPSSLSTLCPIGYARHLPSTVSLSQYEHDHCIDMFFKFYAAWCLRTNPVLFRQDMAASLHPPFPRTSHYSPLLHNAMLAVALGFSDNPSLRHPATRKKFADQAKSYIDEEGMNPTVATVQALANLAAYHSLGAEHNLGWLYIGMSLRCAMALGLNTDSSKLLEKGQITPAQARARNVTFWTAVVQEGLWAPYIGREISMPEYTTGLPVVDDSLDQVVFEMPPWGEIQSQPSMLSTAFVETVKLMQIGERIMNTIYGLKVDMPTLDRTGVISQISLALSNWHDELPSTLALNHVSPKNALPHILMMHLSHAWLTILLHRPFYRPLSRISVDADDIDAATARVTSAVKQCDRAALHIIHLLQIWHRVHNLRYSPPTALQVCFVAGTTHLLSLASSRVGSKKHAEASGHLAECVRLLSFIAVSWPAAEQARLLLDGLRADYGLAGSLSRPVSPKPGLNRDVHESAVQGVPPSTDVFSSAFTSTHFDLGLASQTEQSGSAFLSTSPETGWNPAAPFDPRDWQLFTSESQLDRETQALLDNILQPHLSIDFPAQSWNDGQMRPF